MDERGRWTVPELSWDAVEMTALPTGTVSFLLSDVESSTVQWGSEPEAMAKAIARHYELIDEIVSTHRGVRPVEQGEGDSVVAAFSRPSDALQAALDVQRRFESERWPTSSPLKVRIAVHTGEARLRDEGNYAGNAIIRAARLRSVAHGGQIVVSSATHDVVVDDLATDVGLVSLGVHRLKDLSRPERVWQLVHPDLEVEFPALRSLDAVPNNLPTSLTSFIGRFDAMDTIARLVLDNRLVTVTGTGGAGNTRLAQQAAGEIADAFADGVWWIDLLGVTDPSMIASAVSRAAKLSEDRSDPLAGLVRRLASQRVLLVFDNCEHLLDAAAEFIASILTSCAAATVLATSRAPLNVPGELSWQVPPLAKDDARRLFVDRASRTDQSFRLTDDNAGQIEAICKRLDGIPLAIELAAARCRMLPVTQVLAGLSDAISLLAGGQRGVLPRHQTIDASIRWSHSLLDNDAQLLLRCLSIFAGPFTLDAARAVAPDEQLAALMVPTVLESLVDQSLVQIDTSRAVARFRLLETVRQFARRELDEAGEVAALAARHATYFADRARGLWPLFEHNMLQLLDQADDEFEDLAEMFRYIDEHWTPEEHAEVAMASLPAVGVRHATEVVTLADRVAARVDELSVLGGLLHMQLSLADPTNHST